MNSPALSSLVMCGNRIPHYGYAWKQKWFMATAAPIVTAQKVSNNVFLTVGSIYLSVYFVQGRIEAHKCVHAFPPALRLIVSCGACASIDPHINIGTLVIPNYTTTLDGKVTILDPKLIKDALSLAALSNVPVRVASCGSVNYLVSAMRNVPLDMRNYVSVIDQEAAELMYECSFRGVQAIAVLYVSDNLILGQSLKVVRGIPTLLTQCRLAKRLAAKLAIRLAIRYCDNEC
ncbi:MAG: hypothetical protein WCT08_00865 [Patescibacteria group bacterium]|jgi:nucleoside phosphorylase